MTANLLLSIKGTLHLWSLFIILLLTLHLQQSGFVANSVNEDILLVENVRKLTQITQKPLQLLSAFYLHSTPSYWFTKMSQCNTTFDLLWKNVKISAIIWANPWNKGFWVIYAKSPFLPSSWCPNYKQTTNTGKERPCSLLSNIG